MLLFLDKGESPPVFLLHATLLIPRVTVTPTMDEVQESLVIAGRYITAVSKGVGQWTGGKPKVSFFFIIENFYH